MTEATPLASEQITQEDREAAASVLIQSSTMDAQTALWGGADKSALVQAFARHRIAALSASPAPSGQGVSGEALPPNAVDDQGFSDAECNAVLIDGYARDADRRGWRATGDALRRAAGFIRGYDALTAKAAPAPSCAPGEVERLHEAFGGSIMLESVDSGLWSLRFAFGRGDGARDRMREAADAWRKAIHAALSPQGLDAKEGGE